MIPELGQIALLIALALSVVQALFPLVGAQRGITSWMMLAYPAARLQLLFVAIAFALLTYSFLTHDFSVAYVAHNSNTQLPRVMPMVRDSQAKFVQGRDQRAQAASRRPPSMAATAKAKGTAKPT